MGRDDARPIAGLQGGTAPARAFHDFMSVAVAKRPVEQFETQVPVPDWQLTPEEEVYGDTGIDTGTSQPMVDENGMPLSPPPPSDSGYPQQQQQPVVRPDGTGEPTQQELDQAFPPQQSQPPQPQQRQPEPESPPPDAPQPGGYAT
jgi:penicillin-binding protein 1A